MAAVLVNRAPIDLPVLRAEDCESVWARLEGLRPRWIERSAGFHTVGAAAYLDVVHSTDPAGDYYDRIDATNAMLEENFGDVLEAVRRVLAENLGAPTRFDRRVALPGFHVFEDAAIAVAYGPTEHFDLQHRAMRWPTGLVLPLQLMSFTLPVRLPADGGGLEYWDFTESEFGRLRRMGRLVDTEVIAQTKPSRVHPYTVGVMTIQTHPVLHRIAPIRERRAGDQRITLQGHGIRDADGWILYW